MGCASSKPSSSKNKKKNSSSNNNNNNSKNNGSSNNKSSLKSNSDKGSNRQSQIDELIKVDGNILSQIEANKSDVVDFVVKTVRHDLNAELIASKKAPNGFANVASAALSATENDELIREASSRAVSLVQSQKCPSYRALNEALKAAPYASCKNQVNKNRICDLTVETIRNCLTSRNNILDYLQQAKNANGYLLASTPPQTPKHGENDDIILLTRAEANKVARIMFLTNRARPVIHASNHKKGAYFVNIEQDDKTEIPATREQIEEIISFSTKTSDQPSIYELADQFIKNTDTNLKLSPISVILSTPRSEYALSTTAESPTSNENENEREKEKEEEESTPAADIKDDYNNDENDEDNSRVLAAAAAVTVFAINNTNENDNSEEQLDDKPVSQEETVKTGDEPLLNTSSNTDSKDGAEEKQEVEQKEEEDAKAAEPRVEQPEKEESNEDNDNKTNAASNANDTKDDEDNGELNPTLKQSLLDDRFYNNDSFKTSPPVNDVAANDAATKIQATVRGHQAREDDKKEMDESSRNNNNNNDEDDVVNVEAAATTIQATFRGYKARKEFVNKKATTKTLSPDDDDSNSKSNDEGSVEIPPAATTAQEEAPASTDEKNTTSDNSNSKDNGDSSAKVKSNGKNKKKNKKKLSQEKSEPQEDSLAALTSAAVPSDDIHVKATTTTTNEVDKKTKSNNNDQVDNAITNNNTSTNKNAKDGEEKKKEESSVAAATKIQATFRGFKTRKELHENNKGIFSKDVRNKRSRRKIRG